MTLSAYKRQKRAAREVTSLREAAHFISFLIKESDTVSAGHPVSDPGRSLNSDDIRKTGNIKDLSDIAAEILYSK